ncbi:CMP/dCMP deaminase zinc-binding protein [Oleidesulfovibrio alaskensis G20]|uniref:tRNA-specific adenosine deaminase n=1 Tax=Oleidesulfovibrio alaskensis (strain ATCC BAA-1058 / DSM 17464 / G20) TaxID=207559 RepID=Q310S0_OLEA2|nr:tRNA adenosine(34) deaminase TadA [Oleidesulfovibrio alaskensis]ABB38576.2 CMP/dCMP deaminase zinc-binding protein [Oleidesulfovibrio alaskensis G20]
MKQKMQIIPPVPSGWKSWEALMELALEQAVLAQLHGEVPVGAVVVAPDGAVLGSGRNRPIATCDPTAHAEILAIRQACIHTGNYRLDDAVLVVTLEPCHMCTGAIIHARLAGVVYGASDKRAGAVDSCLDGLELPFHNHRPWYMSGVCEAECSRLLAEFFKEKRQ